MGRLLENDMNNFRDFAYLNLRKGKLFRGSQLVELSREDKELLFGQCGIATVVDLRAPEEVAENLDASIPGVDNINLPLLSIAEMSEMIDGRLPDVPGCYRKAVQIEKKGVWARIFDVLLQKEGGILFHCSQGKDRTGIVVAAILSALGIDRDTIFEDYLRTNESLSMPEEYKEYAKSLPAELQKVFAGLFLVDKDFLQGAFDEIEKLYGGMNGFLKDCCGLDETKFADLKAKFLLPSEAVEA